MQLHRSSSEVFVPSGANEHNALASTTHLGIGAHQDDLEILAIHGILECFRKPDCAFCGVVVTDGAGSARASQYVGYSDDQMKAVRRQEQKKASAIGEYAAQVLLDHPSGAAQDADDIHVVRDLMEVLEACLPQVVYTHNLFDKHDTHVAVALRTIEAVRRMDPARRPQRLIGCEVWRDLDWLPDEMKIKLDVTPHEHLQMALLGVFDSQIAGGKRYDLATMGRRKAHATFSESHGVDRALGLVYGMDLTPLMDESGPEPLEFVGKVMERFASDVTNRINKLR